MKNVIFFLITLISTPAAAQNSGLYGKKLYVESNGLGNLVLFNRARPMYNATASGKVTPGSDVFNYGYNVAIGIAVKHSFAIGLETGFTYVNAAGPEYIYVPDSDNNYYYDLPMDHEKLEVRTFSVMPTMTFGGKQGLLPVGINHQVGVAYTQSRILEKDYAFRTPYSDPPAQKYLDSLFEANNGFVDYDQRYRGFSVMYTLKVRTPVSKNLMINYGLRYMLNITFQPNAPAKDYKSPGYQLYSDINTSRMRSIISLNLGLTYVL
jgi:hypothetical protein